MFFRSWFKKKYLSQGVIKAIQNEIASAEKNTSGEIRIFIESHCKINPFERAKEIFTKHKMYATKDRNGILLYLAFADKKVAVYGDEAIHNKLGDHYWDKCIQKLIPFLKEKKYEKGIGQMIKEMGNELEKFFPHQKNDVNELSDDIIFQ